MTVKTKSHDRQWTENAADLFQMDLVYTPNHRWVIVDRRTKKTVFGSDRLLEAKDFMLLTMARYINDHTTVAEA